MKASKSLLLGNASWKRVKILIPFLTITMLLSACGKEEQVSSSIPSQEIAIHYHADDGEYDENMISDVYNNLNSKEDIKSGKTIITFAYTGEATENGSIEMLITSFNRENQKYYVEPIPCSTGAELEDAIRRISIEVGTGKGPDIMTGDVFAVTQEVLDSGVLVDLAPLMAASGITEENYYPAYKVYEEGEKVYGISPNAESVMMVIDEKVLGTNEVPDMETLLQKLLEYPEKAGFRGSWDEYWILQYFIEGSEDVWGMVDWEEGECDFSGELFSQILEVSKRYGENARNGYEPVMSMIRPMPKLYEGKKSMDKQGKVIVNYYFDDGNFPQYATIYDLLINSNTEELEGAWAFLSYVMSKKGQNFSYTPVHKETSREMMQAEYKLIEEGKVYIGVEAEEVKKLELADDKDVLLKEMESIYSNGRYVPMKAEMIHEIIYEETGSYFAGDKSKEEVIDVIESRVDLYLSELK